MVFIGSTLFSATAFAISSLEKLPVTTIKINNHPISVWLPSNLKQYVKGLKQVTRQELQNKGMLFRYPKQYTSSFTMKGTLTDLELICLNEQGIILEIIHMNKGEKNLYTPVFPCRFALELVSGAVENFQIRIGDKIDL